MAAPRRPGRAPTFIPGGRTLDRPDANLTCRLVALISFLLLSPTCAQQQQQQQLVVASNVNAPGAASGPLNPTATTQQQQQPQPAANAIKPLLNAVLATEQPPAPKGVAPAAAPDPARQAKPARARPARPMAHINQEEPIVQLDYSSIHDEILNKRTANFVYFNAHFNQCRNCNRFFNVWKDLALDIRWWRHLVRLFTINCSDDDNAEVCRRAGVTQFPQLRFYWVQSNSLNQDGQRLRILGKSVHAMRHLIMDKVLDSYLEHNKLLSQRAQQQRNSAGGPNPFAALTALVGGGAAGQPASPLASLVPALVPMLTGGGGANLTGLTGHAGGGGGLAGIVGLLTGKQQPPGAGALSSLMNSFGGTQGISQMVSALMSVASWRRSLSLQPLPSNWPELEPIEAADTQRLLDLLPLDADKGVGALLIMETQEFLYTGLEVMLDLNPYSNQTYIARVRDERSHLSKNLTKRDDIQAPALIYVTGQREVQLIMTAPKYTNDEDLRRAFVRTFERRQIKYPVKRLRSGTFSQHQLARANGQLNPSDEDEEILGRANSVYMADLLNTIRASLLDQVIRHPDLSDDQYNALVKYVYALINYFPFDDDGHLKFFKRLHAWLQNQVSPVDLGEYKKQFRDADEVLGRRREWLACKSLSNVNSMPSSRRRSGMLFENPSQLGKVVSNITRLFRTNQQKLGQLKHLIGGIFSSSSPTGASLGSHPVMLTDAQSLRDPPMSRRLSAPASTTSTTQAPLATPASSSTLSPAAGHKKEESSLERLIKSLTSGSLGSDSSILKLISTALTGGGDDPAKPKAAASKSKFAREYSCGAWKLAHVMAANEYLKDSPRKDVKHIVLHSLHQYAVHFYACATCGNRVSDMSGELRLNLEDHLVDQGDSIMLLWKLHNRVNKRLEGEPRPGSPAKQQFPSEALCPKCRAPRDQGGAESAPASLAAAAWPANWPNWQDRQVLNFLVHHYRPQNIITVGGGDGAKDEKSAASRVALESAAWTANWAAAASSCLLMIWLSSRRSTCN